MKLATLTAAIVIGGGLAVLAVYGAVTLLTALFDSDAPTPREDRGPGRTGGRHRAAGRRGAPADRIRDRKEENLEGVEY